MCDDILHNSQQLRQILMNNLYSYPNSCMIHILDRMVHNNHNPSSIFFSRLYKWKDLHNYILYILANNQRLPHQKLLFHQHSWYTTGLGHKSHIMEDILYKFHFHQHIIQDNILNRSNLLRYWKINRVYNLVYIQHILHFHSLSNHYNIHNKQEVLRIHHKLHSLEDNTNKIHYLRLVLLSINSNKMYHSHHKSSKRNHHR